MKLANDLGADVAVNYSEAGWPDRVLEATGGKGVDIVLEAVSGATGDECFRLTASMGRVIVFGARNIQDVLPMEKIRQLIRQNQSLIGFNLPTLRPEQLTEA